MVAQPTEKIRPHSAARPERPANRSSVSCERAQASQARNDLASENERFVIASSVGSLIMSSALQVTPSPRRNASQGFCLFCIEMTDSQFNRLFF